MSNFTPINSTSDKNYTIRFSKILFTIATIILVLISIIYAIPLVKFFVVLGIIVALIIYVFVTMFTLGLLLLSESYRNLFVTITSIKTGDQLLSYYPLLTNYCFYALILVIFLYLISTLLLRKNRKDNYSLFVTNILMLVLTSTAFIVLLFFKIIN